MRRGWFQFRVKHSTIIIFWLMVLMVFLGIYLFVPSLFNQMRQVSYQNTPYVDTPLKP